MRGLRDVCVHGQPSGEAAALTKGSCHGSKHRREGMEQEVGVHVGSWRNSRKGEHKSKKEPTEGREGEIKNLREDVQSIAQAQKKVEGKERKEEGKYVSHRKYS